MHIYFTKSDAIGTVHRSLSQYSLINTSDTCKNQHIWMYIACIEAHIVTTMKNSYQDGQIHAYGTSL